MPTNFSLVPGSRCVHGLRYGICCSHTVAASRIEPEPAKPKPPGYTGTQRELEAIAKMIIEHEDSVLPPLANTQEEILEMASNAGNEHLGLDRDQLRVLLQEAKADITCRERQLLAAQRKIDALTVALRVCQLQMLQSNNDSEHAREANELAIAALTGEG